MQTLTVHSRVCHALIFVLALNVRFTDVVRSDDNLDLMPEGMKEFVDMIDRGKEWLPDGGSSKPSEPDRSGPGYGFPQAQDIEPTYSEAELRKMQEQEMRQQAEQKAKDKNGHEAFVQNEREKLRYGMRTQLILCKQGLNSPEWNGYATPFPCITARNIANECQTVARDIEKRGQQLRAKYPADRWVPSNLYCSETLGGLENPDTLVKTAAAAKKASNALPAQGSNSGSSAPKQANAPTTEQVMEYVQKSAAECLRRFPNPSAAQVEACSHEKANNYRR